MQGCEDASAGFADGTMFEEEIFPDVVSLLLFGHFPELVVGKLAGWDNAIDLGDEIVIGDELVDAPEHQASGIGFAGGIGGGGAKARRIEMRVHIDDRLGVENAGDGFGKLGAWNGLGAHAMPRL